MDSRHYRAANELPAKFLQSRRSASSSRRFQQGVGPSRGILHDCENFADGPFAALVDPNLDHFLDPVLEVELPLLVVVAEVAHTREPVLSEVVPGGGLVVEVTSHRGQRLWCPT